jgi:outer membrane protein OmpA-like peptidoglycan-associated protein/tetratricopeptide (TPR) repeat protein
MKLIFLYISLFICSAVSAQDFIMKKKLADRYYSRFDYHKAIPMYEQILKSYPRDYAIYEKLADSYRRINDSETAERCYEFLTDTAVVKPDYLLFYAQALSRNGKYDKALTLYRKYAEQKPSDTRGREFSSAYNNLASFYKDSASCITSRTLFNSGASDFSPAYYRKGLVFASARPRFSVARILYNWTYSSYLDLYFVNPDSSAVTPFSKSINSFYHEGPVAFSKNQDTVFFTRSNFYHSRLRKSNDGINKLKLYRAYWDQLRNVWADISPLPLNTDEYSVGHPALAHNGHTLYFVSDMPGGYGGTDIYSSEWTTDLSGQTTWSTPENLGPLVNTSGNEMFPFIDESGSLWFASNGIAGLGGLDIFFAQKAGSSFLKPVNAGYPLNTRFDDFGLITRNGTEGYLSSDRFNAAGNDDIYRFKVNKLLTKGVVRDLSNQNNPVEKADVYLLAADSAVVAKIQTSDDGQFEFPLNVNQKYILKAVKSGFAVSYKDLSTVGISSSELKTTVDITKEANQRIVFFCTIVDKKTGERLNGTEISITDARSHSTIVDTVTSLDGGFRKEIPGIRIGDKLEYDIQISKKGYLSRNVALKHTLTSYEVDLSNFLEVSLDKIDLGTDIGKLLNINPIYFDIGKWDIRKDAAAELDKVVKAMKDNPDIVIELGAHTDSRGSSQSNLSLSDKRAKLSAAYIVSRGIDKARIYGKGYGETMLINKCSDGVSCTEEEHAVNRRTEFKIVKF